MKAALFYDNPQLCSMATPHHRSSLRVIPSCLKTSRIRLGGRWMVLAVRSMEGAQTQSPRAPSRRGRGKARFYKYSSDWPAAHPGAPLQHHLQEAPN